MNQQNASIPAKIDLHKADAYLEITWQDDTVCRYPLSHLREACPCVQCRGGHANMGQQFLPDDIMALEPAREYELEKVDVVGNYAIQPLWDDGHQTGIYSWEYLRHLCPSQA